MHIYTCVLGPRKEEPVLDKGRGEIVAWEV